ncbi:MAG TPA: IclR family transcriptional regulator [Syntrophomonadaceae bacterium]|nr:IclR family transcriptional regulator [Syntrophomonadaceae bacterium]HOQ09721.1 IclR family transcriptional regulator [Syntrophomonadaceae bacterium]HPU48492.1 IclR family transcriptional regulator [Syntrophomonadaceae bacterium]
MSRSVERALAILSLYSREKQEWGITEISQEVQLPKSTVHGLVKTLEKHNFLYMGDNGKYRLGVKVFELGMAYSANIKLTTAAEPVVRQLVDRYKQTVHVAIYAGRMAILVVSSRAGGSGVLAPRVGAGIPAYCTGVGKVLLAWQKPQVIEDFLQNEPLMPITKNTITDQERFREELAGIRRQGYAIDRGEALPETGCIAAPIFGADGEIVAAISVSGPLQEVLHEKNFTVCRDDVMRAAKTVSEVLGFRNQVTWQE